MSDRLSWEQIIGIGLVALVVIIASIILTVALSYSLMFRSIVLMIVGLILVSLGVSALIEYQGYKY